MPDVSHKDLEATRDGLNQTALNLELRLKKTNDLVEELQRQLDQNLGALTLTRQLLGEDKKQQLEESEVPSQPDDIDDIEPTADPDLEVVSQELADNAEEVEVEEVDL